MEINSDQGEKKAKRDIGHIIGYINFFRYEKLGFKIEQIIICIDTILLKQLIQFQKTGIKIDDNNDGQDGDKCRYDFNIRI